MRKIILTLMIIIIIVSGTSTVLMAGGESDPAPGYIKEINRWRTIKSIQEFNAGYFRIAKEEYNDQIEDLDPFLRDAIEEYNSIENRLIIARGEMNAAYSEMMYANSMLDSLSNRSPSQIPPGAVEYWTNKRNAARDRYNHYSAEVPMIEAELKSAKNKLDDLQGRMNNLISQRDGAQSGEDYHQGKADDAQGWVDYYQGLLDGLLPQ